MCTYRFNKLHQSSQAKTTKKWPKRNKLKYFRLTSKSINILAQFDDNWSDTRFRPIEQSEMYPIMLVMLNLDQNSI